MAPKISSGLRNYLTGEGSFRKAFEDAVLKIYSGSAPASPNDAPTGTLLVTVTKASGALAAGARSTPKIYEVEISGVPDMGDIVKLDIDGVNYYYTLLAEDDTLAKVAIKVARMLNDCAYVDAIPVATTGFLYVKSRIDGLNFVLTEETSTGITVTVTQKQAASAVNSLKFGAPATGVIAKTADIWSGVAVATGTAGYFRLLTNLDAGGSSEEDVRMQGTVSTSGADLNLSNLNIVLGATITIDTFQLTLPITK